MTSRARLDLDSAGGSGIDAEGMYRRWAEARRTCPFRKLSAEEAQALLGPQQRLWERAGGEVYIAWSHDDVARVMRDADHFYKPGPGGAFDNTLLAMNGEEHRKYRELVKDAFSPEAIARWEGSLIHPLMHRLIDSFAPVGRADLVRDYTRHFPFHVIRTLLGFPEEDHDTFVGLAMPSHEESDSHRAGGTEFGPAWERALHEFLAPRVARARRKRGDDLLSLLARAEIDRRRLSDEELYRFLVLLIPAGADTTFAGSGNLLLALLDNPDQLELVRRDARLLARAVNEALRWQNSAATTFLRVATRSTEVAGLPIPEGAVIVCHLSAHNRDETRYPQPHRFDVTRPVAPRGIFGYGPHTCLGMHLARAEMKLALRALLERLPDVRLDPDLPRPYVRFGVGFPSPPALPVRFEPVNR